ncbi:hypothetical protein MRY87_11410 [bacterium]|nr:hypothetical protein [bacterium]
MTSPETGARAGYSDEQILTTPPLPGDIEERLQAAGISSSESAISGPDLGILIRLLRKLLV